MVENGSLGIGTFNIQSLLPEKDERLFRAQTRTIKRDLCERIDSLKNDLQNPNFKDRRILKEGLKQLKECMTVFKMRLQEDRLSTGL